MVERNDFDTNYTLLYKNAYNLGEPAKYLIQNPDETYTTIFEVIQDKLKTLSLLQIWNGLSKNDTNFSLIEFCYIYYLIIQKQKRSKAEALNQIDTLINLINDETDTELYENNIRFMKFESVNILDESFRNWYKKYREEYERDVKIFSTILEVQNRLSATEQSDVINLELTNATFEFKTSFEFRTPTIYDGLIVFDQMENNIYIPYIQWNNSNGVKYYKIYENDDIKEYEVLFNQQFRKINTLYFLVMVDEPGKTITKKTYTKCVYSLETNKLKFSVPIRRKEILIERIKQVLPNVILKEEKETNLKGSFKIPSFRIEPSSLHFLLLNDDDPWFELNSILSTYLYIDETKTSIINRDFISLRYRTNEPPEDDDEIEDLEMQGISAAMLSLREDEDTINIVKVKSREILKQFLNIFSRLITIYNEYKTPISELIDSATPEEGEKKEESEKKEKKLAALKAVAPDVFIKGQKGYARKCACNKQPIVVDEIEAEDWKNKIFTRGADSYYRQIGQFPPGSENPKFRFVCPDDEIPYPTLIENNESNKDIYPYIPCCAAEDNISNPKSFYNRYYEESSNIKEGGFKGYKINTLKVLPFESRGNIPKQIQDLLVSINPDEKYIFERFGVGRSPNSFIHCILNAVQDIKYREFDAIGKEEYCVKFRKSLIDKFDSFNIFKQELYDMNDDEIKELILKTDQFFDPALFYRGLEELFNINIFVFQPNREDLNEPSFEIPRNKLMHIRTYRPERYSLIIIKHMGGEAEDLKYPQCELIINSGDIVNKEVQLASKQKRGRPPKGEKEQKKVEFIFDQSMTELLYSSFQKSQTKYLFTFYSKDKYNKEVEVRQEPYTKIRWDDVFEAPITFAYQTIDNYGKTRSFTLNIGSKLMMTLFIPPTQPLNLPVRKEIYYSQPEVVRTIFGEPLKTTKDGFWYSVLGFEYGFFVPCENKVELINPIPIQLQFAKEMNRKPNPIENYRNVKKYTKLLLDLIIWGLRSNGVLNLKDYEERFDTFVKVGKEVPSDAFPTLIYRKLPDVGNFAYLNGWWPEYFRKDNKINLNPILYEKIRIFLKRYYIETDGLSIPPNPYLNDVYEYEWDFTPRPHTRILIGETHFESWNNYYKNKKEKTNEIKLSISPEGLYNNFEPFLYKDIKTSKLYIIQNVKTGLLEKALFLCNHWRKYKFNFGMNPPIEEELKEEPYAVYGLSVDNKIILDYVRNIKDASKEYFQVLFLGNNYYMAMLPLL